MPEWFDNKNIFFFIPFMRDFKKKAKKLDMPLIVRLEGTNSDIAKDIIDKAAIPGLISAVDLDDAAAKAVAAI